MPRKSVIEYECERCGRKWYMEVDSSKPPPDTAKLTMCYTDSSGKALVDVAYGTLCVSCESTVKNCAEGAAKTLSKKSPDRKTKAKKKSVVEPARTRGYEAV